MLSKCPEHVSFLDVLRVWVWSAQGSFSWLINIVFVCGLFSKYNFHSDILWKSIFVIFRFLLQSIWTISIYIYGIHESCFYWKWSCSSVHSQHAVLYNLTRIFFFIPANVKYFVNGELAYSKIYLIWSTHLMSHMWHVPELYGTAFAYLKCRGKEFCTMTIGMCISVMFIRNILNHKSWNLKYHVKHNFKHSVISSLILFFVWIILTSLFNACRSYRDRQKPANGTQWPTLMTGS